MPYLRKPAGQELRFNAQKIDETATEDPAATEGLLDTAYVVPTIALPWPVFKQGGKDDRKMGDKKMGWLFVGCYFPVIHFLVFKVRPGVWVDFISRTALAAVLTATKPRLAPSG